MKEIEVEPVSIKVTNQSDGSHHMVLMVTNEVVAESIHYRIGNSCVLKYGSDVNKLLYNIIFEFVEKNLFLKYTIKPNNQLINWLEYIDNNLFTNLWIGYLDNTNKVILFGQSISLS